MSRNPPPYLTSADDPTDADAFVPPSYHQVEAALQQHRRAVECWVNALPQDRAWHWRAVEQAWRRLQGMRATHQAGLHAVAVMAASGKIRSAA